MSAGKLMEDPFGGCSEGADLGDARALHNEITDCGQESGRAQREITATRQERPSGAGSSGQSLLGHINSGPMSEGHVRLYQNDTRPNPSDPSQNICLFTPCLFLVGAAMLSIGVMFYIRFKFVWLGIIFCFMGTFSAGSAILYTILYAIMVGLRKSSLNQDQAAARKSKKPNNYAPDESSNGDHAADSGFDHFADFESSSQSNGLHNGQLAVVNEGSGLCGSNYVPSSTETVQLNVDNLDFEIKSTQNLDVSAWKTLNGDLPQSYLESFGELPNDLLSSPSLKKGLDGVGDFGNRQSSKKSKKRSRIFDSLRNGSQAFAIKANQKTGSQTELLDSENEGENTLFHVESIGQDSQAGSSGAYEKVTVENGGANAPIVVHFNKSSTNHLIDTFH